MTYNTWHTQAIASQQLLITPLVTITIFQLLRPRKINIRRIYPSQSREPCVTSARESLMYSWSGDCRSPPPWLAWQHTPGLWLVEAGSRDQNHGFLLDEGDRHRSRQTGMMKAAAADVFFSQCDFCPVTFKWHGLGVLWWNTYTSMAQVLENIIKQLSLNTMKFFTSRLHRTSH